jgi:RHS repeat-associated protein
MDRLSSAGKYYPYGEDKGTVQNDTWNFATYWRDSATGLDYAMNRYYSNSLGRFTSPDPFMASGGPADPQSWNRYSYTRGDPVNRFDPTGTCDQSSDSSTSITVCDTGNILPYLLALPRLAQPGLLYVPLLSPIGIKEAALRLHTQINNTLHRQTSDALRNLSSDCQDAIKADGINLSAVAATAANTNYFNTFTEGNVELRDITGYVPPPPNMPNMNLSTYLGSAAAATIPDASGKASNNVVVGGIFFNATAFQQNITLVHEALHAGTGEVDSELAKDFHLGDNLPENAASAAITAWLANGCAPVH